MNQTTQPDFTVDNAKDWRTPDGVRVASAYHGFAGSGYAVNVIFEDPVRSLPGLAYDSPDGTYFAGSVMNFYSDGKHKYGDLQLIYDPISTCPTGCPEDYSDDDNSGDPLDTIYFGIMVPPGYDTVPPFTAYDDAVAYAKGLAECNPREKFHVFVVARVATIASEQVVVTTTYH